MGQEEGSRCSGEWRRGIREPEGKGGRSGEGKGRGSLGGVHVESTGRAELLSPFLCLHALPSTCSEGRLSCTDLPCPGTYVPAQGEVRKSGQGHSEGWDWGRDVCAPVPFHCPLPQCLVAGAHGRSGRRAPSPAGARRGPAPGPALVPPLSTGVPRVPGKQGRQGPSIRRRPAPARPSAQVRCPHLSAQISIGRAPPRPPRAVGAVFPAQWTEPGAHGDCGLPVMRAWGSPIGAGCVSGPPPLREAGPALGATGRVAPARTIPQNAQVRASVEVGEGPLEGLGDTASGLCPQYTHACHFL